jgi:hypothetical protein
MTQKLTAVLGEDGMNELKALLAEANAAPQSSGMDWVRGTLKSYTNWFGALLIGLPDLLPMISPQLQDMLDANAYKRIMQAAGIIVILLRFKTSQSVLEKGKPT